MILRTRVWTSAIGADLHREIELPYAHLLYSKAETDRVVEEMGKQTKYLNWLDSNTYLAIFHRVGFEMIDVRRRMNHHAENVASRVLDMYPWVDPKEALCAELEVRMVKPIEEGDEAGADGEVEYRCITCGTSASQFEALNGIEGRRCPQCGSIERTRALIGWLSSNVDFAGKRIFAVAPSDSANKYISAENPDRFDRCDIRPLSGFEIQADISKMPEVESGSYDFAMAIKVLEHCDDDVNAISEICRILEPRGKFIVMGDIRKGVETENIDDPTSFYGDDAFEEYNIGTFRRYGLEDLEDMLDQFFKVKTYEVEDSPTGYKGFLIECSKDSDRN
jgi:DNA-directed RNA polymerase subunit RPC12/RpoP